MPMPMLRSLALTLREMELLKNPASLLQPICESTHHAS
jgi:hypothetical protein